MLITQLKDKEAIRQLAGGKVFIINCHGCREVSFPVKEACELENELKEGGNVTGTISAIRKSWKSVLKSTKQPSMRLIQCLCFPAASAFRPYRNT